MDSDVKEILKRIAKSYSKEGSEYSFKIFSKEQLQKKSRLFQGMTLDFLIVKTKNGEAAKIAQFVGKKDKRVVQVDAKFYQSGFAKHFNVVQKLVKENM